MIENAVELLRESLAVTDQQAEPAQRTALAAHQLNPPSHIFNNLISNARDAKEIPPRPRNPSIEISTSAQLGDKVKIEVSDNGPGFPKSSGKKIFQPLHDQRDRQGTDWDWPSSAKPCASIGGSVVVTTGLKGGARFTVLLPHPGRLVRFAAHGSALAAALHRGAVGRQGGMGAVYLCRDDRLPDSLWALKEFKQGAPRGGGRPCSTPACPPWSTLSGEPGCSHLVSRILPWRESGSTED